MNKQTTSLIQRTASHKNPRVQITVIGKRDTKRNITQLGVFMAPRYKGRTFLRAKEIEIGTKVNKRMGIDQRAQPSEQADEQKEIHAPISDLEKNPKAILGSPSEVLELSTLFREYTGTVLKLVGEVVLKLTDLEPSFNP